MKNLLYTFALVACLVACKDDEDPSFSKESTFGTWVETVDENGDGIKAAIKIDAAKYFMGSTSGTTPAFDSGVVYTYENNMFTSVEWDANDVKFGVSSVNATTITIDSYLSGANIDQTSYTKGQ